MRAQSITAPLPDPTVALMSLIAPKMYPTGAGTATLTVDKRPCSQPFQFFDHTSRAASHQFCFQRATILGYEPELHHSGSPWGRAHRRYYARRKCFPLQAVGLVR